MYTEFKKRFKKFEIMNAKEKAEELCFKFQGDFNLNWTMSKRCALITVDEIIKETPKLIPDETYIDDICGVDYFINEMYDYWIEVKNDIEKL